LITGNLTIILGADILARLLVLNLERVTHN